MSSDQDRGTGRGSGDAQSPTDEQRAGWHSVRQRAEGLTHHQAKAALEAARQTVEANSRRDGPRREHSRAEAEVEEWERITEALADHAGRYDPDADPFVQGELAGQADREPGLPSENNAA
ncbi:hypothetical protein [Streptomyces sp. NBC_01306]|uniref:hypothetical protein n=1 Tax=Streptomyces sp. NBC_01306 TaxID=2903819 RepID=UPI0022519CBB|nr:hypothetical protein [Streptomyces sp. NBC_01306]MCX4728725.1 hypothetical protein [Streptomyces sp. NBC_01306]